MSGARTFCHHWGIELDRCPQPYQRDLAAVWADRGADLIIGSHPHVLQGIERLGDAWLVNSTGNFAFPSARGASALSALFTFTVYLGSENPAQEPPTSLD